MIASFGKSQGEPPTDAAAMLRLWLRRRRLLLVSVALTVILVPSLLIMVNVSGPYVIGTSDYDIYDYDAVDGVHALVHQMSPTKNKRDVIGIRFLRSPERIRTQTAHHTYDGDDEDNDTDGGFPRMGSLKNRRKNGGSRKGIFRRKIQDSEDVPPEEVKGYAFLYHKELPILRATLKPESAKGDHVNDNPEAVDDEMYHASEDEDDYGVGDDEENPKDAMFEPQPDDDKDEDYLEEDETAYDYWSRNREFKAGDFDPLPKNHTTHKPVLKFEDLPQENVPQRVQRPLLVNSRKDSGGTKVVRNSQILGSSPKKGQVSLGKSVDYNKNYKNTDSRLLFSPICDQKSGCKPVNIDSDRTIKRRPLTKDRIPISSRTIQQRQKIISHSLQNSNQRTSLSKSEVVLESKQLLKVKSSSEKTVNRQLSVDKGVVEYADHLPLHEQPATQLQIPELPPQEGEVISKDGFKVIRDKIYWSDAVEGFVAPGITAEDVAAFRQKVARVAVAEMSEPQWNRCGRPKNQYIKLDDGSALCARYRSPHTKMIQGEILSFYLARLLGVNSVPVCVLAEVNSSAPQWQKVEPGKAGWVDGELVVFIQWIEGLDKIWSQVKMPTLILSAYQQGTPVDRNHPALPTMSPSELSELLQWSDMILFDYIIGHYDRVASMQDGAEREKKESIMSESIRNLRKVPSTNKLWLVDNESGLFDGYELMKYGRKNGPRFVRFHEQMLKTMCLFRKSLINNIEQLANHADPQAVLTEFTAAQDPMYKKLPSASKVKYFKQFFHTRLKEVMAWVGKCRTS